MELTIDRVSKRFKDKSAVDDVSLTLTPGVWGLLGANGAGKTTLMRMCCGIMQPTAGEIRADGIPIDRLGAAYRDSLGYLPQEFGFYPSFTVRDYLDYMAALKGIGKRDARRRTNDLLEQLGLADVRKKRIAKLSGGMKRRVGIAQALLNEPEILILDEPTSGLDPVSRDELLDIFISLAQDEEKTVFCSTHITSDLDRCADNIIYLKQGRIAENEPLCTLLQKYSVVRFSADNAPNGAELIGVRREKDGMSALVRNSELPAGVESAPAGLEDIMLHIEREDETK